MEGFLTFFEEPDFVWSLFNQCPMLVPLFRIPTCLRCMRLVPYWTRAGRSFQQSRRWTQSFKRKVAFQTGTNRRRSCFRKEKPVKQIVISQPREAGCSESPPPTRPLHPHARARARKRESAPLCKIWGSCEQQQRRHLLVSTCGLSDPAARFWAQTPAGWPVENARPTRGAALNSHREDHGSFSAWALAPEVPERSFPPTPNQHPKRLEMRNGLSISSRTSASSW